MSDVEHQKLFSCKSPAFFARYPNIEHKELIPDGALRAMEKSWNRAQFDETCVEGYLLSGVYVVDDGIVFDRDLDLIKVATSWQMSADKVSIARDRCVAALNTSSIMKHSDRTVLCIKPGCDNFGHWSIEMFPFVPLSRHYLGVLDIIVNKSETPLCRTMSRMLELVNQPSERVIWSNGLPKYFEELVVVVGLTRHGTFMSPLASKFLRDIESCIPQRKTDRKLFISRGASSKRKLTNEPLLWKHLERDGFVMIDPGALSLDEQISYFRDAEEIVGPIGAAMTNIAFCDAGTKVTLLVPSTMPDTFFWFLAQHRGLEYREVRGPSREPNIDRSWNGDFHVEISTETDGKITFC